MRATRKKWFKKIGRIKFIVLKLSCEKNVNQIDVMERDFSKSWQNKLRYD
jgi:hypothetical protein